jgi:hypothetical protein
MRKTLLTVIVAASITLVVLQVLAAPSKTVLKGFHYTAPIATTHVAVPGTKAFPTDLLPQ